MRFSDVRSKAYQVFDFDFLAGNDGLQHQLVELSTDAQSNGDVEFSFPDGTRKRAYTPLFFIAAQNRLPELFGTVDSSGSMPVVHVTVDLEAEVLAALQACYESRTLENLWSAMGCAEYQLASKFATFVAPSPQCDLPPSVAPDFTIQLKSPRARDPIFSIKVHRFLLPIRLSYFRAKFSSRFMDSGAPTATFHTEEFTPFSMWCVASYVYQAKPWDFFSGFAQLRAYIGDSPSGPHWTPTCASFGDAEVPPKEIADRLIEIVLSADFLGVECLVNWAHYSLARFAHEFSCRGRGCSTIVPYVMDLVANNEFSDRWLFEKGIQSFSDRRSICMWKRPLLMCKNPAVVDTLLERVKESMCNAEWTVEYFMRVEEVGRKTAMSDKKAEWAERIINPLLDHAAQCTANSFNQPAVVKSIANVLSSVNPSRPTIEAFLEKVVRNETIKANNCQQVLYGIRMLEKLLGTTKVQGVRDAKDRCINWFRRNYISLSVLPAPDGFEGNFFSTWNSHELDSLLEQMPQEAAEVIRPHSKVLNSYPVSENYRPVKSKFPKQSRGKAEKRGREGERERRQDSSLSVSDAGADIGSDAPPDALNLLLGEDGSSIF